MVSRVLHLYLVLQGLISTQGQVRKWVSDHVNTKLLSFNRTQSTVVTDPLRGRNTLRKYPYLLGLIGSPLCGRYGTEEETSAHVLCEWQALVSLRHTYLDTLTLDPEDFRNMSLGAIWNFRNGTGGPRLDVRLWGTKGPF